MQIHRAVGLAGLVAACGLIQPDRGSINLNYQVDLVRSHNVSCADRMCVMQTEYVLCRKRICAVRTENMCFAKICVVQAEHVEHVLRRQTVCVVQTECVSCARRTRSAQKQRNCTKSVAMHRNEPKLIQSEA